MLKTAEQNPLSKTLSNADLNSYLTQPMQESLLRLKNEYIGGTDKHWDTYLYSLATMDREAIELMLCKIDIIYFCTEFCKINDIVTNRWVPFNLWPAQVQMVKKEQRSKFSIVLKTRQFGATWYFWGVRPIHESIFTPNSVSLLYEPTDTDAVKQLSSRRVRGMAQRIPQHIMGGVKLLPGNRHEMPFLHPNGDVSIMQALNPEQGRGDSGSYCAVDEADFVPDLNAIFDKVESAVNAGGKMVLVSTSSKNSPNSVYKNIFKKSWYGEKKNIYSDSLADAEWDSYFIPWHEHPNRNQQWYDAKAREILERTGSLDELWANYPSTVEEALAPAQMGKRLPVSQLQKCLQSSEPIETTFNGRILDQMLRVYKKPKINTKYYIGVDTAEGLDQPETDFSSIFVIDEEGEDVANITAKYDPVYVGALIRDLSKVYNNARAMIENNNHGGWTINWLQQNGHRSLILQDPNNKKLGYNTNQISKAELYINVSDLCRNYKLKINDPDLYHELQSINKDTLKAPKGDHDDRAMAYCLAQMARIKGRGTGILGIFDLPWN